MLLLNEEAHHFLSLFATTPEAVLDDVLCKMLERDRTGDVAKRLLSYIAVTETHGFVNLEPAERLEELMELFQQKTGSAARTASSS
ncbi:hypothetical protein NXY56_000842 [Leishmania guyanensis]